MRRPSGVERSPLKSAAAAPMKGVGLLALASPTHPLCQWTRSCRGRVRLPSIPRLAAPSSTGPRLLKPRAHGATTRADHRRPRADRERAAPRAARASSRSCGSTDLERAGRPAGSGDVRRRRPDRPRRPSQRAVAGVDAVVHLGAVPDEAPFEEIAGPNLHGAYHVFEACRRAGVRRVVYASSNHATGMYPVGEPLDGSLAAAPGRALRRVQGVGRGARAHVRRPLRARRSCACGSARSSQRPRERRELVDVAQPRRRRPARAGGADRRRAASRSSTARRRTRAAGGRPTPRSASRPDDDAEAFAERAGAARSYPVQGGPNAAPAARRLGRLSGGRGRRRRR